VNLRTNPVLANIEMNSAILKDAFKRQLQRSLKRGTRFLFLVLLPISWRRPGKF